MKKILLSLTLIAALTIGTGVMAFATENNVSNEEATIKASIGDTVITTEEVVPAEETVNPNCSCEREECKDGENCDGIGNGNCNGTGMKNGNCDGSGIKNGNCDGSGIKNGNCDGKGKQGNWGEGKLQGQGMRRGQGNCNR